MSMEELDILIKYSYMAQQDGWEQSRFSAYITAQCNSTQKLKQTDILSFSWEKEDQPQAEPAPSKEDAERLRAKSRRMKERLYKK